MNKLQEGINRVRTFIEEVRTEMKKCSWPTRSELFESTTVVIMSVLITGGFVGMSDLLLYGLMRLVIR